MKEKVVFFGSSKFVIPILDVLRKNFDLALIITTENPRVLKGNLVPPWRDYPVVKYCVENKIPYHSVSSLSDQNLKSLILNPPSGEAGLKSPVAVLADFGLIIPKEILNSFPKGILNIHPSLLPKYRGPTPVQEAILNGEKFTGVSIIKIDDKIDHGPLLGQEKEKILLADTSESLYKRLFEKGANLLIKVLNKYIEGNLKPRPQNHKKATFTKPLTRQDGYLDISNALTAVTKIDTRIRAYFPWPGVFMKLKINNKELRIKLLPDKKIQVEGKKPVSYKDFINGYPEAKNILSMLQK